MKKLSFSVAVALTAASGAFAQTYPLTIENCGREITFERAPDSVVSIGQATTEALYTLGLADKVSGTAVWFTEVLPEFAEANAGRVAV